MPHSVPAQPGGFFGTHATQASNCPRLPPFDAIPTGQGARIGFRDRSEGDANDRRLVCRPTSGGSRMVRMSPMGRTQDRRFGFIASHKHRPMGRKMSTASLSDEPLLKFRNLPASALSFNPGYGRPELDCRDVRPPPPTLAERWHWQQIHMKRTKIKISSFREASICFGKIRYARITMSSP